MTETHRILSVDLGTSLGWAWQDAAVSLGLPMGKCAKPESGVWVIPNTPTMGARFYEFRKWLWNRINGWEIDGVIFARPFIARHPNITAIESLFGLAGQIHLACHEANVRWVRPVQEGKAREYFCGVNKGKDPVIAKCQQLGWSFETDDEADALCVLSYGASLWRKENHDRDKALKAAGFKG